MSYQKKCNFCGTFLSEKRKDDATGKWIVKNLDGKPHEYRECKAIQANRPQQPNYQPKPNPTYRPESSTFSRDEEPKATGVTMYSLLIKLSDNGRKLDEVLKRLDTLASIVDSMAQKQDLMINKIGYPEPKPVLDKEQFLKTTRNLAAAATNKEDGNKLIEAAENLVKVLDRKNEEKEIKAVQRHPTPEELANSFKIPPPIQVINPMRVQKEERFNTEEKEMLGVTEKKQPEELGMYWETISEAFVCHNCSSKIHNGFMKLGTKLCEPCKLNVEANESEDEPELDRSDVNNYKPRTIEDINDDI